MTSMKTIILATLGLLLAGNPLSAQPEPHWLAERASTSDLVMLAQLERIDYEYRRDFPVDGRAWFRPLITYKPIDGAPGLVIVTEKGLHENECYFPRMLPWDEGPRYLLFLVRDAETGTVRGHPEGCAIEVLVNSEGRYAARWPQLAFGGEHGRGDEALQSRVETMRFQGPRSAIDASDLLAHQRRDRAERDFMRVEGETLVPTRGIELGRLRELMQPGLVPADGADSRSLENLKQRLREAVEDSSPQQQESDGR